MCIIIIVDNSKYSITLFILNCNFFNRFNIDCSAVIIGTSCNSICMLSGLPTDAFTEIEKNNITLSHLASGHMGKVKKIAVHPSEPIIATVSSDKTLRMWNYASRRQICSWKTIGAPTCVAFRYDIILFYSFYIPVSFLIITFCIKIVMDIW